MDFVLWRTTMAGCGRFGIPGFPFSTSPSGRCEVRRRKVEENPRLNFEVSFGHCSVVPRTLTGTQAATARLIPVDRH